MQTLTEKPKQFSTLPTAEKLAGIRDWLEEHKALDVTVIDLAGSGAFAEGMIVATATSVRHAQRLHDTVLGETLQHGHLENAVNDKNRKNS